MWVLAAYCSVSVTQLQQNCVFFVQTALLVLFCIMPFHFPPIFPQILLYLSSLRGTLTEKQIWFYKDSRIGVRSFELLVCINWYFDLPLNLCTWVIQLHSSLLTDNVLRHIYKAGYAEFSHVTDVGSLCILCVCSMVGGAVVEHTLKISSILYLLSVPLLSSSLTVNAFNWWQYYWTWSQS
jgi:hypothetical protein